MRSFLSVLPSIETDRGPKPVRHVPGARRTSAGPHVSYAFTKREDRVSRRRATPELRARDIRRGARASNERAPSKTLAVRHRVQPLPTFRRNPRLLSQARNPSVDVT